MFLVLFTGSRTWSDFQQVEDDILDLFSTWGGDLVCMHGDGPRGLDAQVRAICDFYGIPDDRHPADWSIGKQAGYVRNAYMVSLKPQLCLAYPTDCDKANCKKAKPHDSHGTDHCATLAEQLGILTLRRSS